MAEATITFRKSHWQEVAERLFLDEYDDPKTFYEAFSEPTSVYAELASRVVSYTVGITTQSTKEISDAINIQAIVAHHQPEMLAGIAYSVMSKAFALDAAAAATTELDNLVTQYTSVVGGN